MNELAYRAAERRLWRSIGAQPTERRIHLERIGVDVRIQEIGAGPPVLFIHGVATSGVSWAGLAARAKGFRCLVLDRPGTGLSEPLGRPLDPGTLAAMADVLVADVLDALEVPSAHIVASSFGGYMALRSAAATPERGANGAVQLAGGSADADTPVVPASDECPGLPPAGRGASAHGTVDAHALPPARSPRQAARRRISREDLACYLALIRHTDTMRHEFAPARALISPIRGLARLHLPDDVLGRVRCPTVFVWGGRDPFGGEAVGRALAGRILARHSTSCPTQATAHGSTTWTRAWPR